MQVGRAKIRLEIDVARFAIYQIYIEMAAEVRAISPLVSKHADAPRCSKRTNSTSSVKMHSPVLALLAHSLGRVGNDV